MDSQKDLSTSSDPKVVASLNTPSLKDIFRGDSELVDFFRFVDKEGYREKALQMISDRISKLKKS